MIYTSPVEWRKSADNLYQRNNGVFEPFRLLGNHLGRFIYPIRRMALLELPKRLPITVAEGRFAMSEEDHGRS